MTSEELFRDYYVNDENANSYACNCTIKFLKKLYKNQYIKDAFQNAMLYFKLMMIDWRINIE